MKISNYKFIVCVHLFHRKCVYIKPNRVRSFHGNKMNYSQIRYAELVAHHKLEWGWRQNIIDAQTNQRTRTHRLNDL